MATLGSLRELLMRKQWVRGCQYLEHASYPVVSLKVDLALSGLLKPKELRKLAGALVSVDLSLSKLGTKHEGVINTEFLGALMSQHEPIRSTALLLKELLRVFGLNKPYRGGIGSYSLVLLVYWILKARNQLNINNCYIHLT